MGKLNAGIDFLEFRPSEIAAAVAISVSGEVQAVDIDKAMSCFILVGKVNICGAHRNKTFGYLQNPIHGKFAFAVYVKVLLHY